MNQQPLNLKSSILAMSHSAALLTYLDKTNHNMLYNTIQHSASWWGMNQQPLNLQSTTEPLSSATHLPEREWSWHAI